jgi:DNA invertase Pin-like site-specific DNA recombinase
MLVGYARVSTYEQNMRLQTDALNKAGCEKLFTDRVSGTGSDRPGLKASLEYVRKGDTLLIWRLDRLARSLKDLIAIIGGLEKRGIGFRSLQESMDTTTSGGRFVFHVFGALAEFERNLVRERTRAGLAAAHARGRKGGRPRKLDAIKIKLLYQLYDERKHTLKELCRILGISKPTLYTYLQRR